MTLLALSKVNLGKSEGKRKRGQCWDLDMLIGIPTTFPPGFILLLLLLLSW